MAKTYKNNLLVSLLKLLGAFIISWFIIITIRGLHFLGR